MKRSRFTEDQIIGILKAQETGCNSFWPMRCSIMWR